MLRDQGLAFECTIVGEGDLRSALESQIEQLALGDKVKLVGARFHDQVLALYSQFDLFVLCSITEGQPVVLMEAMRAGIPIIASNISAIPELLQGAGTLVPANDPLALAKSIQDFAINQNKYQQLALRGMQVVSADYNLENNHMAFRRFLDVLE
jgi:glycosyltransferase involved in cell wall biosynthesis